MISDDILWAASLLIGGDATSREQVMACAKLEQAAAQVRRLETYLDAWVGKAAAEERRRAFRVVPKERA